MPMPEDAKRHPPGSHRAASAPDFVLAGAPKCGTTSLAAQLGQHPELFMVRGEPHFFGSDIAYNRPRLSARRYQSLFAAAAPEQLRGERSTWYLMSQRAAAEIHAHNPAARIIIQLREPAALLHSLHGHHLQRGGREDIADFAAALAAEDDRRAGRRMPPHARFPESLFYSGIPRYSEQIGRFLDHFGEQQVAIVLLDDLRSDPARVCRQLFGFLGVDDAFVPDFRVENRAAPVQHGWLHRLWKQGNYRYTVRRMIPQPLYQRLRARRQAKMARRGAEAPRPPLPPDLRRRLNARFESDIRYLESLLQRDLGHWRG